MPAQRVAVEAVNSGPNRNTITTLYGTNVTAATATTTMPIPLTSATSALYDPVTIECAGYDRVRVSARFETASETVELLIVGFLSDDADNTPDYTPTAHVIRTLTAQAASVVTIAQGTSGANNGFFSTTSATFSTGGCDRAAVYVLTAPASSCDLYVDVY